MDFLACRWDHINLNVSNLTQLFGYADLYTLDPFHRMALYGAIIAVIHEGTKVVLQFGRSVGLVRVSSLQ